MKSTNYSVKGAFGAVFKATLRRQLPGAAVIAVICACISVVSALLYCNDSSVMEQDVSYGVFTWGLSVLFVLAVYCAVSIGVMYNSYFSRRACDYHFALPYKRSHIYNSNFLFGLLAVAFAILFSAGVFAAVVGIIETVYKNTHFTTLSFTVEYGLVIKPLVTLLAALLAGYSVCSMCAAVAGKWLQYALFCFICIVSTPVMLIGIASRINVVWGLMVDIFRFSSITPVGVAAMILREPSDNMYIFMTVVSLVEFIGMYVAGLLAFKRRKAEIAESGQGGTLIKYILMAVFVISGFVYFSAAENFFATAVTGVIVAFICAVLFSAGQVRRKKIFTRQTGIIFGAVTGVCLVLTAGAYFANSSSYVKYVPKAEEVQSVTVTEYDYFSRYTNETLWYIMELLNGESAPAMEATLTDPQNIQKAIDFHNLAVSDEVMNYTLGDRVSDLVGDTLEATTAVSETMDTVDGATAPANEEITENLSCTLEYKLKNGRTVKRSYVIEYDLWHEFLSVFKTQEAIMQQEPFSCDINDIMYVEGIIYSYEDMQDGSYATTDSIYILSPQEWEDVRDVLAEERINESDYDFRYGFGSSGYFTVNTIDPEVPQEQQELMRGMTPLERYNYVADYNRLMLQDPQAYPLYPVNSYSVDIHLDDENTVRLMQSPEMQDNKVQ